MKSQSVNVSTLAHVEPSQQPLVAPASVKGGKSGNQAENAQQTATDKANALNAWAAKALEQNSESLAAKAVMKAECSAAIAAYYEAVKETEKKALDGAEAVEVVEAAKQGVARAYADAILANVFDRTEVRSQLGQAFGFEASKTTGKPTSKPVEPGNTIAKRVSSVTIAAEYAMTGQLPDRGGESLPLVGQDKVRDELEAYFAGEITVRAASERIEAAIRNAKVSVPLEMDADKVLRLAGKIQTASEKIAGNSDLAEAYKALFQIIASIPFPVEMEEAA